MNAVRKEATGWLRNSRFWILAGGVVLSVNLAGLIQFQVPDGTLQLTRIEQAFAFLALGSLFLALLAAPLAKLWPTMPGREHYLHARRAIGVLAFYFAFLHSAISFFGQFGGFAQLGYVTGTYQLAFLCGGGALVILLLMAATSTDWAIRIMTFRNWKRLHRFVYLAGGLVLVHIFLIGPHYTGPSTIGLVTYIAVVGLAVAEILRLVRTPHRDAP